MAFVVKSALLSLLLAVGLAFVPSGLGQEGQRQKPAGDNEGIKLETTLVQVPVIVRTVGGRYVTDLKREDFIIYEDGVKQNIELFTPVEEPFNVALLLDSSGSTAEQLNMIKAAALAFIDNLRPEDRVMVVGFNDSVQVLCELTSDREILRRSVASIERGEYTQVYEAIYTVVWERMHDLEGRKAVLVFSDFIDTASSEITEEDTLDAVIETEDVIIYAVRYNTRPDVERRLEAKRTKALTSASTPNVLRTGASGGTRDLLELDRLYRRADEYMFHLAELSGGIVERADGMGDLKSAFRKIADELRQQYLLGYYPLSQDKDNRDRKVVVRVGHENVKVRSRYNYRINK